MTLRISRYRAPVQEENVPCCRPPRVSLIFIREDNQLSLVEVAEHDAKILSRIKILNNALRRFSVRLVEALAKFHNFADCMGYLRSCKCGDVH